MTDNQTDHRTEAEVLAAAAEVWLRARADDLEAGQ